jgi:hypothetical protein
LLWLSSEHILSPAEEEAPVTTLELRFSPKAKTGPRFPSRNGRVTSSNHHPEDFTLKKKAASTAVVMFLLLVVAAVANARPTPANVAGTWTISVSEGGQTADQTIDLKQDGGKITGTFKGPRQQGTLEGTVDGNNIKFHVNTRVPFDYTGTVDGDSMKGTFIARGKTGDWTAKRAK